MANGIESNRMGYLVGIFKDERTLPRSNVVSTSIGGYESFLSGGGGDRSILHMPLSAFGLLDLDLPLGSSSLVADCPFPPAICILYRRIYVSKCGDR